MRTLIPKTQQPSLIDQVFNFNSGGFFDYPMTSLLHEDSDSSFPPVDITSLDDDNRYYIRLSIAGYNKDELDVSMEENNGYAKYKTLTIKGTKSVDQNGNKITSDDEDWNEHINNSNVRFFKKNIATRNFTQRLVIGENDEVENCKLENGILLLRMKRNIPEEKNNMKRIEIQ